MTRLIVLFALAAILALPSGLVAQAQPRDCAPGTGVQFVCGLQAPEDLVALPGAQWIVAGAYGGTGGLYLIRASDKMATLVYPAANATERLDAKTYAACPGAPD